MTSLLRSLALIITGMVFAIGLTIAGNASAGTHPAPVGHHTWEQRHPCKQEDGVNCFWNADSMGNHHGHSFFTRWMPGPKGHRITCVIYTRHADAHWDYCS